jgi:hypothetical protein
MLERERPLSLLPMSAEDEANACQTPESFFSRSEIPSSEPTS